MFLDLEEKARSKAPVLQLYFFSCFDLVDSNNTRRYYYNNNWQVLSEYDGSGTFKAWYAYGNYIDELVMMGTGPAAPFAKWYVHDHLYSPAALVAWGGTVVERYEYDAYGSPYILEPNFAADPDGKSDYGNPYLFTGRRVDLLDNGSLTLHATPPRYTLYAKGCTLKTVFLYFSV